MPDAIRKAVPLAVQAAAMAWLTGCAGDAPAATARAAPPAPLVAQQIVDQERRCTYLGKDGEYFIALEVVDSCPARHAFLGEQWDGAARRAGS